MDSKKQKLNNTIKILADVLEKNKDKQEIEELYKDVEKLKEKRNIK